MFGDVMCNKHKYRLFFSDMQETVLEIKSMAILGLSLYTECLVILSGLHISWCEPFMNFYKTFFIILKLKG